MNVKKIIFIVVGFFLNFLTVETRFFSDPIIASVANSNETVLSFDADFGGSDNNPLAGILWQSSIESGAQKLKTYLMLNENLISTAWHGSDNTILGSSPLEVSATENNINSESKNNSVALALNHQPYETGVGTGGTFFAFQGEDDPTGSLNYIVSNGFSTLNTCRRTDGPYSKNQYPIAAIGSTTISFAAFTEHVLSDPGLESGYRLLSRRYDSVANPLINSCGNWSSVENLGTGEKNIAEDLSGAMSYAGMAADTGALVWKQKLKNKGILEDVEEAIEDCIEEGICEVASPEDISRPRNPRGHSKGEIRVIDNVLGYWQDIPRFNSLPIGFRDKRLAGVRLSKPNKGREDDDRNPQVLVDNVFGSALAVWVRHNGNNNTTSVKASYRLPIFTILSTNKKAFRWEYEFDFSPLTSDGENMLLSGAVSPNQNAITLVAYTIKNGTQVTIYYHILSLSSFYFAGGAVPAEAQLPRVLATDIQNPTFLDVAIDKKGNAVAIWVENNKTLKASIFIFEAQQWSTPEIIRQTINPITRRPRVKMHPSGSTFISFMDPDTNHKPVMTSFNQLLPITLNNVTQSFITHDFVMKNIQEDPHFSPSCEQVINYISAQIVRQVLNRTATQGEYANQIEWSPVDNASAYIIERNGIPIASVNAPQTTYIDHNVRPTGSYTYAVIVINTNGSSYCNQLTWDKHPGLIGYEVFKTVNDSVQLLGTTDKETTTFLDCDTQINDQSCNNCPSSEQAQPSCAYFIVGLRPAKTPDCVFLTWEPVLDGSIIGYNIYRSDIKNVGACCLLGTVNSPERFEFADCNKALVVPGCPNAQNYTLGLIQKDTGCDRCNVISWQKPVTTSNIIGYNVYRDNKKIGDTCSFTSCNPTVIGADNTSYTDCDPAINNSIGVRYFVVAVIEADDGTFFESFPSNGVIVPPACSVLTVGECPTS